MRAISPNSVLLVDDDPNLREILSIRLEKAGFEARQAADGIDGLVKLRDELPKVIIVDVQMPRMAGIEFISVVRRRFPFIWSSASREQSRMKFRRKPSRTLGSKRMR